MEVEFWEYTAKEEKETKGPCDPINNEQGQGLAHVEVEEKAENNIVEEAHKD